MGADGVPFCTKARIGLRRNSKPRQSDLTGLFHDTLSSEDCDRNATSHGLLSYSLTRFTH